MINGQDFHEKQASLSGPKSFLTLTKLQIKPDCPSLAAKIDEPRPYINIKDAAFTVSDKPINT